MNSTHLPFFLLVFFLLFVVQSLAQNTSEQIIYPPDGSYSFDEYPPFWSWPAFVLSMISMVVGMYYCTVGYRFWKITLWLTGFIFICTIVFLSLNILSLEYWYLSFAAGVVSGIVGAWIMSCFPVTLYFLLGYVSGFVVIAQIWGGFFSLLWGDSYWFFWTLWVFSISGGIPFGIVGLLKVGQRESMIMHTSIFGGYLFVIGLDFFARDQFAAVIVNMFLGIVTEVYPWYISLTMVIFWIILTLVSIGVQMKIFARDYYHKPKPNRAHVQHI